MKHQLTQLITELEKEIREDIADGTTIADWYQEIGSMIIQAKRAVQDNNYTLALELIGDINIDLLEQVDEFDDLIGEVVSQLHRVHKSYLSQGQTLPDDIQYELQQLKSILDNHEKISQLCH